jgi:hypothetical protein
MLYLTESELNGEVKNAVIEKIEIKEKITITISEIPDTINNTFEQNVIRLEFEKNIKELFGLFGIVSLEKIENFKNIPCKIVFDKDKLIAIGNSKLFLTIEKIIELSKK